MIAVLSSAKNASNELHVSKATFRERVCVLRAEPINEFVTDFTIDCMHVQ